MRFTIEQHFAASIKDVESALIDPAFLDRLGELPKLGRPRLIDQEVTGSIVRQRVQHQFTGEVNSAVRRVVDPAKLTWIEESTVDRDTHVTTWKIVPDHYANLLRASGTFALMSVSPERTLRVAEGELKVSVPLAGGRVEKAIVSGLRDHAELEEEALAAWLEET